MSDTISDEAVEAAKQILEYCANIRCNGSYPDPDAEAIIQRALDATRREALLTFGNELQAVEKALAEKEAEKREADAEIARLTKEQDQLTSLRYRTERATATLVSITSDARIPMWIKTVAARGIIVGDPIPDELASLRAEIAALKEQVEILGANKPALLQALRERDDLRARLEAMRGALGSATKLIEGLASQQAMDDHWYVEELERLKALASEAPKASDPTDAPETKVGVMAVIRDKDGRVLLGLKKRAFDDAFVGKWVTPGGRVEFMEPLESAIVREVMEEIGLTVEIVRALPSQEIIHDKGHYVFFSYLVRPMSGEPKAGDDISEVRWFTDGELNDVEMTPITRASLRPPADGASDAAAGRYVCAACGTDLSTSNPSMAQYRCPTCGATNTATKAAAGKDTL